MRFRIFGRLVNIPKIIIFLICGAACVAAVFIGKSMQQEEVPAQTVQLTAAPTHTTDIQTTPTPEPTIKVYIVGCIVKPGVYEMPENSLIDDLVKEAGGFTEEADREHINLAAKLSGGMMIRVPSVDDSDKTYIVSATSSDSSDGQSNGKVNINTADLNTLMTLPGIGESTARKIISYREENGFFESIEDIMNVPGIKEGKFASIKDLIVA